MLELNQETINSNKKYFVYLEKLRKSGKTNMWGASPYLEARFPELTEEEAENILITWIRNYDKLNKELNFAEVR